MDDIYDYIKADHQKVAALFKQFEHEINPDIKVDIAFMIIKELMIHSHSEQETFYKALEQHEETMAMAGHGEEEHNEIENKITQIVAHSNSANRAFEIRVKELKKLVEHHVHEEENSIFSKAKKVLPEEEAIRLREQMHTYKTRILQTALIDNL